MQLQLACPPKFGMSVLKLKLRMSLERETHMRSENGA